MKGIQIQRMRREKETEGEGDILEEEEGKLSCLEACSIALPNNFFLTIANLVYSRK